AAAGVRGARSRRTGGDAMASLTRALGRIRLCERGAELIEFAVALPILMLLVAGIADFAILFQQYEVVTNAAREGARVGVLPSYQAADIQARVYAYLQASGLKDTAPAPVVTYSTAPVGAGGLSISVVRVVVRYPHQFIFLTPVAALLGAG